MDKHLSVLYCLVVSTLFLGCSIFDQPETELEKLPPMTRTGEWSFGCLVNGNAVTITNSMLLRAETRQESFIISITNTVSDRMWADKIRRFEFVMTDPLEIGVEYDLTDSTHYKVEYTDYVGDLTNCIYKSHNTLAGQITFSNIDRANYIISGTFNFETATQNCDKIKITNGRFDMHYFPY